MKKYIKSLLLGSILISMLLTGCSNGDTDGEAVLQTDTPLVSEQETKTATTTNTSETTTEPETTTTSETTESTLVSPDRETILRNVCWGDTKEIIKYVETDDIIDENENALMYDTYLSSNSSYLVYYVDEEYGLYQANYLIKGLTDARVAHGSYSQIVEAVSSKYGNPASDEKKTLSSLAKYCDSDYDALELGYIAYIAKWEYSDDTVITLALVTINYELKLSLKFETTSFEPAANTNGL